VTSADDTAAIFGRREDPPKHFQIITVVSMSLTGWRFSSLYLNTSAARRRFKYLLGNANQLLVTILIGLHAVEHGVVTFNAPHNLTESTAVHESGSNQQIRSGRLSLKSSSAWV
jgi:hypothetical protein